MISSKKVDSTQDDASACELFLARVGCIGHIGRFLMTEPVRLSRGDRAVFRTTRGIELGTVLGPTSQTQEDLSDGRLLRKMTPEDELLWGHLQRLAQEAHDECAKWLESGGQEATLLEVEPLLDGRTLYFHFLSDVEPTVQNRIDELATIFEGRVRESKFANLLEHGCGPGCGTEKAENGCGSRGGCAVCKVSQACGRG